MVSGGNTDNRTHKQAVRKMLAESGRCSLCAPHGGENYGYGGKRHGKFMPDGSFRPSKPKQSK